MAVIRSEFFRLPKEKSERTYKDLTGSKSGIEDRSLIDGLRDRVRVSGNRREASSKSGSGSPSTTDNQDAKEARGKDIGVRIKQVAFSVFKCTLTQILQFRAGSQLLDRIELNQGNEIWTWALEASLTT